MVKAARLTILMSITVFFCSVQAQEQMILSSALYRHFEEQGVGLQSAWDDCWDNTDTEALNRARLIFCQRLQKALYVKIALDDMKNMLIPCYRNDIIRCEICIPCFKFPSNPEDKQQFSSDIVNALSNYFFIQDHQAICFGGGVFQLPHFAIIFPSESLWSQAKNIFKTSVLPTLGRVVRSPDARFVAAVMTLLVIDSLLAADDQTGALPDENITGRLAISSSEFDDQMCTDEDFCDPEKNKDFGAMFSAIMRPIVDNVCGVSLDMKGVIQQFMDGVGGCNRFRLSEMMKIQREFCHLLTIDDHTECRVPDEDYE